MYYIMNAGILFNDKKVTIEQGVKELAGGTQTILVCRRQRSYDKYSKIFVSGSGHGYEQKPTVAKYTQDTGLGYGARGDLIIDNVIHVTDGKIVSQLNDIGVNEKRNFWVMK